MKMCTSRYIIPPLITILIWSSIPEFGGSKHGIGGVFASICPGSNAWYYDGGTLEESKDICKPFTKYCYAGRNQGRYWQNYTRGVLDLEIVSTSASILHLNTTILFQHSLSQDDEDQMQPLSDELYLSLLKYWSPERRWNQTLAQVKFDLTHVLHELRFCVKQYPSRIQTELCDFQGIVPVKANLDILEQDPQITFIVKFDLYTKGVYVFVHLGSTNVLSSFLLQIDTESVQHYKGQYAFKIERIVNPKPPVYFNSVFHTEGGSSFEDLQGVLTFQKLFPEMYCPVQKETFCDLSETCINKATPCTDKTGHSMVLSEMNKRSIESTGNSIVNFDDIDVNTIQKLTIVLSGKNGIVYPVIGHSGNVIDVVNISSEFTSDEGKKELDNAQHHIDGVLNDGPKVSFNATVKCTVFSIIILFAHRPNQWCVSGNLPKIYIGKEKQIILLGQLTSNPRFWQSIDVSGDIKHVIRVKIEKRKDRSRYEEYPRRCVQGDFISVTNIGIVVLGIVLAIAVTGVLSNYFHRYGMVRQDFINRRHHGDYPGPEIENDIEINILRSSSSNRKLSSLHRQHHTQLPKHNQNEYPKIFSPIEFDHKTLKLPIEKENILDEANTEEFVEGVKVVNNIVYLED